MGKFLKATLGTAAALVICVGIVYATAGADFDWLSVSDGGIRVGEAGAEGEDAPDANTIEFSNGFGQLRFSDGGLVLGEGELTVGANGGPVTVAAGGTSGEMSALMLWPESSAQQPMGAGLFSNAGDVGMGRIHFEGEEGEQEMAPDAAVLCMEDGDVVVQLGTAPAGGEGEGEGEGSSRESLLGGGSGSEERSYRVPVPPSLRNVN